LKELLQISFSPVNAVLSILCLLFLLYWLLVIFTGLNPDFFSVDFDTDIDAGVETSLDVHHTHDKHIDSTHGDGNAFISVLKFFNFDELPLFFMLTVLFICMWFISVNVTAFIGVENVKTGALLLIPNFIVSLFVIKMVAHPLAWVYKHINHKGEEEIDFIGRRCTVLTSIKYDKTGQIELVVNGDPIKIYARSNSTDELKAGSAAVIVNESADKKYYLVEKFDY
jgi:hypothetical protein